MTDITTAFSDLEKYIEKESYKGYDCYDALNSPVLSALSFNVKKLRIAYIQALKISPINLRPLLLIPKGFNPKGLGLLLSASSKLYQATGDKNYLKKLEFLANLLQKLASAGYSGKCWGYNFDWQSRVFFVPKSTPTIVNTSYIAHAFLDAFEATNNQQYLDIARSTCDFILNDLNHTEEDGALCFSYTPIDRLKVHNANILGGALLARVFSFTKESRLAEYASRSVVYVMRYQQPDGSWFYAETKIQKWIDSFHTGFVLESLDRYMRGVNDASYESNLKKGYEFFIMNFFLKDGIPKYYHNKTYPIDIHSAAQGIVTLTALKRLHPKSDEILENLISWVIKNMQNKKGYFYFQRRRFFTNKISYMRWSQAWMYHALAQYLTSYGILNHQGEQ
ncbi:delta-aminolevulinic acid dehydratase [bacterium]|nr:delta-aminolevulinic acid dehydratase [bacterium]